MAMINLKVSYLLVVIRYVNVLLKQNKLIVDSNIKTDYVTMLQFCGDQIRDKST